MSTQSSKSLSSQSSQPPRKRQRSSQRRSTEVDSNSSLHSDIEVGTAFRRFTYEYIVTTPIGYISLDRRLLEAAVERGKQNANKSNKQWEAEMMLADEQRAFRERR